MPVTRPEVPWFTYNGMKSHGEHFEPENNCVVTDSVLNGTMRTQIRGMRVQVYSAVWVLVATPTHVLLTPAGISQYRSWYISRLPQM